jgi:NADH:ubiquinone oxidoreductase subunit F (NADH-binding)
VCNADESEPGTFTDRVAMEGDPFALLEGMTIAAFATGCHRGYLYIRGEYPEAETTMVKAIAIARWAGLLGSDILGSGFGFEVEIRRGAGAYICGEETALFESIEGKRGEPRNKPPFPVEVGLFGAPTVVNTSRLWSTCPSSRRAVRRSPVSDRLGRKAMRVSGCVTGRVMQAVRPTLRGVDGAGGMRAAGLQTILPARPGSSSRPKSSTCR